MRRLAHLAATLAFLGMLCGCASLSASRAEGMHDVLDTVTLLVDPLYSAATVACDGAEARVVARDSDAAEDDVSIAEIRRECDKVFASFETLRIAQLGAREAIEIAREDGVQKALHQALDEIARLSKSAEETGRAWEAARSVLEAKK